MRDKNCLNCSNNYDCNACVCYNKWQAREQDFEVKSFLIDLEAAENKVVARFEPIKETLNHTFIKGG